MQPLKDGKVRKTFEFIYRMKHGSSGKIKFCLNFEYILLRIDLVVKEADGENKIWDSFPFDAST